MSEYSRAKAWRERHKWSLDDLADLSGYSRSSIWWFERGQTAPTSGTKKPRPLNAYAWQRYKRVCHSVEAEFRRGKPFEW